MSGEDIENIDVIVRSIGEKLPKGSSSISSLSVDASEPNRHRLLKREGESSSSSVSDSSQELLSFSTAVLGDDTYSLSDHGDFKESFDQEESQSFIDIDDSGSSDSSKSNKSIVDQLECQEMNNQDLADAMNMNANFANDNRKVSNSASLSSLEGSFHSLDISPNILKEAAEAAEMKDNENEQLRSIGLGAEAKWYQEAMTGQGQGQEQGQPQASAFASSVHGHNNHESMDSSGDPAAGVPLTSSAPAAETSEFSETSGISGISKTDYPTVLPLQAHIDMKLQELQEERSSRATPHFAADAEAMGTGMGPPSRPHRSAAADLEAYAFENDYESSFRYPPSPANGSNHPPANGSNPPSPGPAGPAHTADTALTAHTGAAQLNPGAGEFRFSPYAQPPGFSYSHTQGQLLQENQNQNHQHDGNAYMQSPHAYAPPSMEEVSRGIAMRNQAFQRASTRPPLSPPVQQTNQGGHHPRGNAPTDRHVSNGEGSADEMLYQVRFKRASRWFLLHAHAPRNIEVNDYVRVEADRGDDLGVVQAKVPVHQFSERIPTAGYRGRGFSSGQGERKWLLRLATLTERLQIRDKVEDEEQALKVISEKVDYYRLPMLILDAEYQFDRHKLVFFFEADRRIDFRELVSELFSLYKTRIWMQQVDTTFLAEDEDPGVLLAKRAGLLPEVDKSADQGQYGQHGQYGNGDGNCTGTGTGNGMHSPPDLDMNCHSNYTSRTSSPSMHPPHVNGQNQDQHGQHETAIAFPPLLPSMDRVRDNGSRDLGFLSSINDSWEEKAAGFE